MKASLVKIKVCDDGSKNKYAKWCATNQFGDSVRSLCTAEAFGFGESDVKYDIKTNGLVTCPKCIEMLKFYKQFKY